jgi:hypothetical protein
LGDAPDTLEYQRRQGDRPSFYYPRGDRSRPLYSFSQVKATVEPVLDPDAPLVLQRWRERVGEEEAERICAESKAAGEMGHKALENWSQNKPLGIYPLNMTGYRQALEKDILPYLQRGKSNLSVVDTNGDAHILSEVFVADFDRNFIGRLDLVTRISVKPFNARRVLLELKGSRNQKKTEHMQPHIIQAVAYQQTFNKVASAYPKHLEVLDGVAIAYMYRDGYGTLLPVFGEELMEYERQWEQWLDCFRELLGGSEAA